MVPQKALTYYLLRQILAALLVPISNVICQNSYAFSQHGDLITTSCLFHTIFDVQLHPLRERMRRAQAIYYKIQNAAIQNPNHSGLRSLHLLANRQYSSVNRKFADVERFFTRSHHSSFPEPTTVTVIGSTPSSSQNQIVIDEGNVRQKRFAQFLASLFGGALTGTIFGILNGQKLGVLNSQLKATNSRQAQLIHIVSESLQEQRRQNTAISDLESLTTRLTELLSVQEKELKVVEIQLVLQHTLHTCEEFIDLYLDIVRAAHNHRLAYGAISYKEASALISSLTKKARQQHLHLSVTQPAHLLQVDVSMLYIEDGLRLALHIPAFKGVSYKLNKYHFSPMKIDDLYFIIKPEKQYLAVNNEDDSFIEISDSELSTCNRIHSLYICDHITVISKPSKPSCLNSLFRSKPKEVSKFCKLEIHPPTDEIVALSKNAYISYTEHPISVKLLCDNGTQINKQFNHIDKFFIPERCFYDLPHYKVYGVEEFQMHPSIQQYIWPLNATEMLPSLDMAKVKQMISLAKNQTLPPFDPHQLQQIQNLEKESASNEFHTFGFFTVLGIACFALLLACLVLILIYWAAKKKNKKPYSYHPPTCNGNSNLAAHYSDKKVHFENYEMCGKNPASIPPPHNG